MVYLESDLRRVTKTIPVLLLQGKDTSAEVWSHIGTIKQVAALGYRVVALDMPGMICIGSCSDSWCMLINDVITCGRISSNGYSNLYH